MGVTKIVSSTCMMAMSDKAECQIIKGSANRYSSVYCNIYESVPGRAFSPHF